jgi:hypothetical protein
MAASASRISAGHDAGGSGGIRGSSADAIVRL